MVSGRHKSGSLRKVAVKTPGSKTVTHYRERKPKQAKCGSCGKSLPGVPRKRAIEMANVAKSQKRPERPFGGNLCSACSRRKIIEDSR